ncbi:Outer membrane scaffolding protein for murein synthesis, MipA/OmpV family [Sphingomonas sp. NFR04]|uniref:MipA/OmpV family protein n=1 Tax=Sphingomonas sp. NFR04 TaxID=1566283 RepID=UPI0008EA23B2|nr:MipA/OmpV family protein [Sphingomonas sp. NFR04]SFJ89639.1 Outer membrane scaffolding protein for murein synthesis, MipA/OmpV family [Sphingomonas sp. NFR04]
MPFLRNATRAALASLPLLAAAPAFAQQNTDSPPDLTRDTVTLGVGVATVPSYDGSDKNVVTAAPLIRGQVSGINFVVLGSRAWADAIADNNGPGWDFQAGPVVNVNLNRTSRIDDRQVSALGKIGTAVEAGGFVGIGKQGLITSDYDKLTASFSYVHDVGSVHKSYVMSPSVSYGTPLSRKAFVLLNLSANYMGNGYAQTYFGVTPGGSARSGLPVYYARKGWKDWTLGAMGNVALTGDLTHGLSAIGGVAYRRMLDDAADSPVVRIAGSRNQWYGALGLAYTF